MTHREADSSSRKRARAAAPAGLKLLDVTDPETDRMLRSLEVDRGSPHRKAGEVRLRRLLDLADLRHPNLRVLLRVEGEADRRAVLLEHLPPDTLKDAIRRVPRPKRGPSGKLRALIQVFGEVLEGLIAAHEQGVTHGAFSASQVFLAHGRAPVVGGWHYAGTRTEDPDALARRLDTDAMAAGATLFFLLTGEALDVNDERDREAAVRWLRGRRSRGNWVAGGMDPRLLPADWRRACLCLLDGVRDPLDDEWSALDLLRPDVAYPAPPAVARFAHLDFWLAVVMVAPWAVLLVNDLLLRTSAEVGASSSWIMALIALWATLPGVLFHRVTRSGLLAGRRAALELMRGSSLMAVLILPLVVLHTWSGYERYAGGVGSGRPGLFEPGTMLVALIASAVVVAIRFAWRDAPTSQTRRGSLAWGFAAVLLFSLAAAILARPLMATEWVEGLGRAYAGTPDVRQEDDEEFWFDEEEALARRDPVDLKVLQRPLPPSPWPVVIPVALWMLALFRYGSSWYLQRAYGDTFFAQPAPVLGTSDRPSLISESLLAALLRRRRRSVWKHREMPDEERLASERQRPPAAAPNRTTRRR